MAYDQGYYQAPQRPYNGRAAQPPAQAYGQGPPPQQYPPAHGYPPQGPYDQYAQDDYGQDEYGNGYSQDYEKQYQQQQSFNGGGGGQRDHYPPQNNGYPPQQEYYGNGGGRGGEDPRSQSRNGGRGGGPGYGRPPPPDGRVGGGGRGYPNGNGAPVNGHGQRPPPLGRSTGSDPGSRRPIAPPPRSPQEMAWDNPFPGFPGAKKKASGSEEQKLVQQMGSMDVNDPRRQNSGSKPGPDPRNRGPAGGDPYGRTSGESQRNPQSRAYPPQQGYGPSPAGRSGPGPAPGYGRPPPQNGYGNSNFDQGYDHQPTGTPISPVREGFAPISRSMTLPNDLNMNSSGGPASGPRYPAQAQMNGPGPSAPYNGPVGRGPPRPATANDVRPPPQRTYIQHSPENSYSNIHDPHSSQQDYSHQPNESISDLYDAYYDPESTNATPRASFNNETPSFDNGPANSGHRRGRSIDGQYAGDSNGTPQRQQVNGHAPMSRMKSQPDFRAQVQPQSAVYEMAENAPPMPSAQGQPHQGYPDDRNAQYGNQPQPQDDQKGAKGAGQWYDQQMQNVGGSRPNAPAGRAPPAGPSPYNKGNSLSPPGNSNGPPPPRNQSMPKSSPLASEVLPSHPVPVRAGLIPNSVANHANNKPPPVRNYNNTPSQAPITQAQSSALSIKAPPPGPPPVTMDELERLKVLVKSNPTDQTAQLTLARKWIEAADVLVPQLPDQKSRNKTRERYIFDAHKMLKKLVATQNTDAMFFLADCYGRGSLGLETDNKEAFSLYQSAAKAGHAGAAYRTAVCCELGNEEGGGTRKDPLKAIQWYKRAAMLGDTPAMYKMGMIQLKGLLGQPKNPREAIGWLKRAAERADPENPHALHELGLLYESVQPPDGSGVIIRDEAYALSLFQQAAELGYKFSQFRLGSAYEYGLFNLPIDSRLSIAWYSRAAVQEEHQSELALSGWYLTGSEGVLQQSDTEAYLWARKAAMAGLAKAEYAMGYFTEVGIGAPADLEGAKRWYWRAAAQNFPKARERLEDLKKGGSKPQLKARERVSRSKIGKQNEGECAVM